MSGRADRWFVEAVFHDRFGQDKAGYTCGHFGKRIRYCGVVHRTKGKALKHSAKLSGGDK